METSSTNFDPVVTRVITESSEYQEVEPPYSLTSWRPTLWNLINTVRTPDGVRQRLVVIPAQYRATHLESSVGNQKTGTARRFSDIPETFTITCLLYAKTNMGDDRKHLDFYLTTELT